MKVAISTDSGHVSAHFGRCPEFTILQIDDGKITNREIIPNPGHHPGFLPGYFEQMGIEAIIAGGGGQRAQMDVIVKLCKGELEGGESLCRPGAGKGYGLEKDECDHGEHDHH